MIAVIIAILILVSKRRRKNLSTTGEDSKENNYCFFICSSYRLAFYSTLNCNFKIFDVSFVRKILAFAKKNYSKLNHVHLNIQLWSDFLFIIIFLFKVISWLASSKHVFRLMCRKNKNKKMRNYGNFYCFFSCQFYNFKSTLINSL